jgi:hypothetical protein
MATKYRRDLTFEDFYIVKKFKHCLLKWSKARPCIIPDIVTPAKIQVYERHFKAKIPMWYPLNKEWKFSHWKEVEDYFYLIQVKDFRRLCRYIDSSKYTEGKITNVLNRFSLIGYALSGKSKWDINGQKYYALEYQRLSETGTIGKKREFIDEE